MEKTENMQCITKSTQLLWKKKYRSFSNDKPKTLKNGLANSCRKALYVISTIRRKKIIKHQTNERPPNWRIDKAKESGSLKEECESFIKGSQ
ncbi:hypothetical protein [Pseudarcicella hirudinis]|uniref:hypothetical protein n=1 Tax=Pseudarcicella hirudinis TaxID=1079859 RepID=UPI0015A5A4EF|nr:hypothetical protein [Pseudarcicella hirudinis]